MNFEQWYDEHGQDAPEEQRTLVGWCAQCKEPVFSDEAALRGQIFHGGKNPPEEVLLHRECFREWVNDHIEDEELIQLLDFMAVGEPADDGY